MIYYLEQIQRRDEFLIKETLETKDDLLIGLHSVIFANGYCSLSEILTSLSDEEINRILNWFNSPVDDTRRKFGYLVAMIVLAEGETWYDSDQLTEYVRRTADIFSAEMAIRDIKRQGDTNERFERMCKQFYKQASIVDYEKIKIK